MDRLDDYRDEMDRLSSDEADQALSGRAHDGPAAAQATDAAGRLRAALLRDPNPDVAEAHLALMRASAQKRRNPMARRKIATLGLAATLALGAGLAGALTLPEQAADEAKDRVAEVVPTAVPGSGPGLDEGGENGDAASAHGAAVSDLASSTSLEGCLKGQAIAELASSKSNEHRNDDAERTDACTAGEEPNGDTPTQAGTPAGSGSGSGAKGGGGGGGGAIQGSGGGSGSSEGGSGSGGSTQGSGGGGGGQGGGSGSGGPSGTPGGSPEDLPTPGE